MARIRSVHPGLWTDENFVEMGHAARLFLIGLWNEADDYGVVEWRPTKLKMRLAPADAIDAGELMEEIAEAGFIARVERAGKVWAVIRNFRKWQRPKNPSAPTIEIDREIASLIALPDSVIPSPPLPQSSPSPSGKSPQMEDGGDKMEEVGASAPPAGARARANGAGPSDADLHGAVVAWNAMAGECGLVQVRKLNANRKARLRQRIHDAGGLSPFIAVMHRIRGSPFCLGAGPRGWRADFDFVLQETSFLKLAEGGYDDRPGSHPHGPARAGSAADKQRAAFDEVERRIAGLGEDGD